MTNVRTIVVGGMVVLVMSLAVFAAESAFDAKAAKLFKVQWSSITYNKTITIDNRDVSTPGQPVAQPTSRQERESLHLSARIQFLDPNRVMGTTQQGVITQLVDGAGHDVDVPVASLPSNRFYKTPRYDRRTQPPPMSRWQTLVQSTRRFLRLPPPRARFQPYLVDVLQPNSMSLELEHDLLKQPGSEIRRIKGYFGAVVPESMELFDVPFEPNDTWVRITPELEIRVQEATRTGSSYRYLLQTRGEGWVPGTPLNVRGHLPGKMITGLQLIGMDGKPISGALGNSGSSSSRGSGTMRASGSGLTGPIMALRFTIAVKPSEKTIPFEFEHIPLPKP